MNEVNDMLSKKAFEDYISLGDTDVVCPICKKKPTYYESADKYGKISRASVSCGCGCIAEGEIYL